MKKITIIILSSILVSCNSAKCNYSGCERDGIGWVKCSEAPSEIAAYCSGGAVRYEESGGYCSKSHAINAD